MELCAACGATLSSPACIHGFDRLHDTPGAFEVRVCGACGSGRTFPLVPPEELVSYYPRSYGAHGAPASSLSRLLVGALMRWHYDRLLHRPPFDALGHSTGRLLDVGAGSGDLGVALEPLGWKVVGLEPSADACRRGRLRGLEMVEGTLQSATAEALGNEYDAVVFQHSLEHVTHPAEELERARELLRDDGVLLVSLPNFGSWQRRAFGSTWFHLDLPRHRTHFTAQGLEALLRACGFEDWKFTTSTTIDGLPMSLQYRLFGHKRFRTGISLYLAALTSVALLPASIVLNVLRGGGDVLGASARRKVVR